MIVLTAKQEFWKDYYEEVASDGTPWLDCSNERTHLQTISLALESAGQVGGRRCLELGCGRGHLSRCLDVLEASERVAVDQVESMLDGFAARYPQVSWHCRDAHDHEALKTLGRFDLIFALEVLQYLPIHETLQFLAKRLLPDGRLVGVVPNADCPLVQNAMDRFDGNYVAADVADIKHALDSSAEIAWWVCRGMSFAEDQRVAPYELSSWTDDPDWATAPNRILFVAQAKSV